MYTPVDPLARFGAMMMMMIVVSLILISAYDHRATRAVEAAGPALAPTPRIVMVMQTAATAPTAAPLPTPEPQIVIQYVEVPVYLPATTDMPPPAPVVRQQPVEVPAGAVQVWTAPPGERPVVSSVHVSGLDGADRPARLDGETAKQVTP